MKIKDLKTGDFYVYEVRGICEYAKPEYINGELYYLFYFKNKRKCYAREIDIESKYYFYASSDKNVTLSNFDNKKSWQKKRDKALSKAKEDAEELLQIYLKRKRTKGYKFSKDNILQKQFQDEFQYELTPDQFKAIQDIKLDMESENSMDRLIIGDVGSGKTEIAIQTSFKAVQDYKQVIVMSPTTILAQQHFQNFVERFKGYNINIGYLESKKNKNREQLLKDISCHNTDIIIGTHNLLQDSVKYADVGLLIIDEEQRFGSKHKEKIKSIVSNIDVLSLSATPIPRTLNLSILGIRDISIINTSPSTRKPIITEKLKWNDDKIKDIIMQELNRKGQIYFVYNNIDQLETIKNKLLRIIPSLKILILTGKTKTTDKNKIMNDFQEGKADVLLATTIIEVGVNISNVNTMIILEPEMMGLSSLHQIRGRVGRNNKQGYCYLVYNSILDTLGNERLNILCKYNKLGDGIKIAELDLKMRGCGDIIGTAQKGLPTGIGISYFQELLGQEIQKQKELIVN